jgi:hypothetical protein
MCAPLPWAAAPSFWLDVSKTLIGAFAGAALAFAANIYVQHRQRRRDNLVAGNMAVSVLSRQVNSFFNIRKAFESQREIMLQQVPQAPLWVQFKPIVYTFNEELRFNFAALALLFESNEPRAVSALITAETRYFDLIRVVEELNTTAAKIQDKHVQAGITVNAQIALSNIESTLGPAILTKQAALANGLIRRFAEDEKDYLAAATSLREVLLKRHKRKGQVFRMEIPSEFARERWPD